MCNRSADLKANWASDSNPCNIPPGLPACDTPCVCKKLLPPPLCGLEDNCPAVMWNSGSMIYCAPSGCCIVVHFRHRYCGNECQLSIDWLEYLAPGAECNSCQMVPYHFTSYKNLLSAVENWILLQPYGSLYCFTSTPRLVRLYKAGCVSESLMPFDSCGNLLSDYWGTVTNDTSCYSYIKPRLKRVIAPCNNACCVDLWEITKDTNGATIATLKPNYPKYYGVECSPRINPAPPGVDSLTWIQNNPPQYDPNAECKNTCDCTIPLNATPPFQYNIDCFPSQLK